MKRPVPLTLLLIPAVLLCWLAMMAVHEAGHVLHAVISGGRVTHVVLHPLRISRTDVSPNPHPLFVIWGGFLWGVLLPLVFRPATPRRFRLARFLAAFFAGFCLIANGGYLAAGAFFPAGDTRVLRGAGVSPLTMGILGVISLACGLYCWHRLDSSVSGSGRDEWQPTAGDVVKVTAALVTVVALEVGFSMMSA